MDLFRKFLVKLNSMDLKSHKADFPIFKNLPGLVYLDSTATSLKPRFTTDKLMEYYTQYSANVFRGVYKISEKATEEYEETRKVVAEFINAKRIEEVIFTRSTTESLNLVAYSMGRKIINEGDEVVTSVMEHHSNFVTWQQLALENGATFKAIPECLYIYREHLKAFRLTTHLPLSVHKRGIKRILKKHGVEKEIIEKRIAQGEKTYLRECLYKNRPERFFKNFSSFFKIYCRKLIEAVSKY